MGIRGFSQFALPSKHTIDLLELDVWDVIPHIKLPWVDHFDVRIVTFGVASEIACFWREDGQFVSIVLGS